MTTTFDGDGFFNSATVDQQFSIDELSNLSFDIGAATSNDAFAQTFQVGISGSLQQVSLPIYCPSGDLQVSIQTLTGANPSGTEVDSVTIANGLSRINVGLVDIPLNDVMVSVGQQLAIVVNSSGECRWAVSGSATGYVNGSARFFSGGRWLALFGNEFPFRTKVTPFVVDNCPRIANSDQADLDNDQVGDVCDDDMDGDNALFANDTDDRNPLQCSDQDLDMCEDCISGVFNPNDDGTDSDSDGLCDIGDANDDGDMFDDAVDNCDLIVNDDQADLDNDQIGDACDDDSDGDNVVFENDSNDRNALRCSDQDADGCDDCSSGVFSLLSDGADTDLDGMCNIGDANDDGDLFNDVDDNCNLVPNNDQTDLDNDQIGDACDIDMDGDNALFANDTDDRNPLQCSDQDSDMCEDCSSGVFNPNDDGTDTDSDGLCDIGDANDDGDMFDDVIDNCDSIANDDQADINNNGIGDVCEDDDMDAIPNGIDNCPLISNTDQADIDSDSVGDLCDDDADGDQILVGSDTDDLDRLICLDSDLDQCDDCTSGVFNTQDDGLDTDMDGMCNMGDLNDDDDLHDDSNDNCPLVINNDQADADNDGLGDLCDTSDDSELCIPIKASNGGFALVCL